MVSVDLLLGAAVRYQAKVRRVANLLTAFFLVAQWGRAESNTAEHSRVVELVTHSLEHYQAGRYKKSIGLLREAYGIESDPTILYNIARAYEGLGDLESALDSYRTYLLTRPGAEERAQTAERIGVLKRRLEDRETKRRNALKQQQRDKRVLPASKPPSHAWLGGLAIGVATLAAGGAIYYRGQAGSAVDEFDTTGAEEARDRAVRERAVAYSLAGAAGLLGAAGITLLLWPVESAEDGNARSTFAIQGPQLRYQRTF